MNGSICIYMAFDDKKELLKCHVVDNGRGIKASEIPNLFTRFGKLYRTAAMNSEGIGMGLLICQNLVNLNHGEISVFSEGEEKGSVFTFSMKMMR